MSVNKIQTYPEMNEIIKDMLADDIGVFHQYIAKRIEELEETVLEQDQELYKIRYDYAACSVDKGRAVFALRVLAGVTDHPEYDNDHEMFAFLWLKKHGLMVEQNELDFNISNEEEE